MNLKISDNNAVSASIRGDCHFVKNIPASHEDYEAAVTGACERGIYYAINHGMESVVFDVASIIRETFSASYIENVLFKVFDDICKRDTQAAQAKLTCVVLIPECNTAAYNCLEQNDINKISYVNCSFGGYGDKLKPEFETYRERTRNEKSFAQYLYELIERKGIAKFSEVYKTAGISKFTFSKIMNLSKPHQPAKGTVAALSIGLKLNLDEAQKLYNAAGYYLGYSDLADKIIRFFIEKQLYDIDEVNYCLLYYDLPILGEKTRDYDIRIKR